MRRYDEGTGVGALLQQDYMRVLRTFLLPSSTWYWRILGDEPQPWNRCRLIFSTWVFVFAFATSMHYFITHLSTCEVYEFIRDLTNLILNNEYTISSLTILCGAYNGFIDHLFNKFHLVNYRNHHRFDTQIFMKTEKNMKVIVYYIVATSTMGCAFYIMLPVLVNVVNGAFKIHQTNSSVKLVTTVYMTLPFDYETSIWGWSVVTVLNSYIALMQLPAPAGLMIYLLMAIFQVVGHIDNLKNNLEKMRTRVPRSLSTSCNQELFDKKQNDFIRKELVYAIQHYEIIRKFMEEILRAYNFVLAYLHLFMVCGLCIALKGLLRRDTESIIINGLIIILLTVTLGLISFIIEYMSDSTNSVDGYVYSLPWELSDRDNRRTVLLLLLRVQSPVRLHVFGLLPLGNATFTWVMKTTYSYFSLLREMEFERN